MKKLPLSQIQWGCIKRTINTLHILRDNNSQMYLLKCHTDTNWYKKWNYLSISQLNCTQSWTWSQFKCFCLAQQKSLLIWELVTYLVRPKEWRPQTMIYEIREGFKNGRMGGGSWWLQWVAVVGGKMKKLQIFLS